MPKRQIKTNAKPNERNKKENENPTVDSSANLDTETVLQRCSFEKVF